MLLAINAVREETMRANMAAKNYKIPPLTLKNRISGRVKHRTKPGSIPYLTEGEEKEMHGFQVQVAGMDVERLRKKCLILK